MPFEEFYRQNFKTVYGFLLNLCKNSDLAEELTAETFLKAFEHYKSYNKKYKPSTWLCAIAKNEYLKYLLIEIPKHMEDRNLDFLEELLPWSEHLPTECKK